MAARAYLCKHNKPSERAYRPVYHFEEMTFNTCCGKGSSSLLLIPGLGVSYEIFLPLIDILKDHFHILAAGIDGFLLGRESTFTSDDDHYLSRCFHSVGVRSCSACRRNVSWR